MRVAREKHVVEDGYDQFNRAAKAEHKAAMRTARTIPTTPRGIAALISHVRRTLETGSDREVDWQDWVPTALKTVAGAIGRIEKDER